MKSRYLALVLIFPAFAYARVGESEEQCAARYGPADQAYEHFEGKQKDTKLFHKAGFEITIHYFEGKADCVIYSKAKEDVLGRSEEISETELKGLLKNNSEGKVWISQRSNPFQKDWTTEDGTLIARYKSSMGRALVVLTKDCLARKNTEIDAAEKEKLKEL